MDLLFDHAIRYVRPVQKPTRKKRGRRSSIPSEVVREMRYRYWTGEAGVRKLAKTHNLSPITVSRIVNWRACLEDERS